jgi:uncharacterized protein YdaU (DUF1376 family)
MSFAYMPFYTGDYLRDTRHLTPLKHGIYLLLLMHCWDQKGPVPLDEQEAAGIANCRSSDEIDSLKYILNRFFVQMDDGWYNKRMTNVIVSWEIISKKRSKAGKLSASIRARTAVRKQSRTHVEQELNKSSTLVEHVSVASASASASALKKAAAATRAPALSTNGANSANGSAAAALLEELRKAQINPTVAVVTAWVKAGVTVEILHEAVMLAQSHKTDGLPLNVAYLVPIVVELLEDQRP